MSRLTKRFSIAASLVVTLAAIPASCANHRAPSAQPPPPPAAGAAAAARASASAAPASRTTLPDRLTDAQFWELSQNLSEPNGSFRSDNLLSNEVWLQTVIPDLLTSNRSGRVYMGVGPEQNFTYISALKPAMVFIVDVRRGNLDLHLMYKALFDLSTDRADFLSKLFSRPRPAGLTKASSAQDLVRAYSVYPALGPDDALPPVFEDNFKAIVDNLKIKHHLPLREDDVPGIRYVYEYFGHYGPELTYWMSGGFGGRGGFRNSPTYGDLMIATDGNGTTRSYLASEENWNVLKALETKNLLVPVVGNFAGPKAIRSVGAWLRQRNTTVSAFYLSNVEQYLNMDGVWMDFCRNSLDLPIDQNSQFIRAYRPHGGAGFGGPGGLVQGIFPMAMDLKQCSIDGL